MTQPRTPGWLLALPYMKGEGIVTPKAESLPQELYGKNWIYCGEEFLSASDWKKLLYEWVNSLAADGNLILWFTDVRRAEPKPGYHRLILADIQEAVGNFDFPVTCIDADTIDEHVFVVIKKVGDFEKCRPLVRGTKSLLFFRLGAHGDALMSASVLPYFKEQGYTITAMVSPFGEEMLRNDPHIDNFLVIGRDQLFDADRQIFFKAWSSRFDRFVNMSSTCEGHLLTQDYSSPYYWSDEQRRRVCSGNYLEYTHFVAGAPLPAKVKFYPDKKEKQWAQEKATELGPFILWQVRGGGIHKWWPYTHQAIVQLLAKTNCTIVLAGDKSGYELEHKIAEAVLAYHGDASRLRSLVDKKSIRDVIALAQHATLVVGPETGVMHGVSFSDVPKILFLSHSAASNIGADWVNCEVLEPKSACYPCHRLHTNHIFCPQDIETGAAACATSIDLKTFMSSAAKIMGFK